MDDKDSGNPAPEREPAKRLLTPLQILRDCQYKLRGSEIHHF